MKLKRDIVEALRNVAKNPQDEDSEMLLRDLEELTSLPAIGPRMRFLLMRIEGVLCERPKASDEEED